MTRALTSTFDNAPRRRAWSQSLAAALSLTLLPGGAVGLAQQVMPVGVDAARLENVTRMHVATGEIAARRRSTIASEEQGIVRSVSFDEGDHVRAGDVLAVIDEDLLRLQLSELQAEFNQKQAAADELAVRVDRARRDLTDLENLRERNAAQAKEIEDARSELAAAFAAQKSANAAVDLVSARIATMQHRIQTKRIRAPFEGVIVVKRIEAGQWVSDGGAIAEIVELDMVDAVVRVPEFLIDRLSIGTKIEITAAGRSEPVSGKVRALVPEGDLRARTYPVMVLMDNADGKLMPGMSVRAWVPTAEYDNALTISRDAVQTSPTGLYVYAVREETVDAVPVTVVSGAGVQRYAVQAQLAPGTLVVVEGNEQLYPGAKVTVTHGAPDEKSPDQSGS